MTKTKIRIMDDTQLRRELDREYESSTQAQSCRYALMLARHILETISYQENETIEEGFLIDEKLLKGDAGVGDVRKASLRIHRMARGCEDPLVSAALRVCGHAVATGHMKEHAMVASDYAVRVIGLLHPDKMDEVRKERLWQIDRLKEIKSSE